MASTSPRRRPELSTLPGWCIPSERPRFCVRPFWDCSAWELQAPDSSWRRRWRVFYTPTHASSATETRGQKSLGAPSWRRRGIRRDPDRGSAEVPTAGAVGLLKGVPLPVPELGSCRARQASLLVAFRREISDAATLDESTERSAPLQAGLRSVLPRYAAAPHATRGLEDRALEVGKIRGPV